MGSRWVSGGAVLVVLLAFVGLAYLRLTNNCEELGRQIKALERQRDELHKQVVNEAHHWANARSTRNMERLMALHGIAMSWPAERNSIRLKAVDLDEPTQLPHQSAGSVLRD